MITMNKSHAGLVRSLTRLATMILLLPCGEAVAPAADGAAKTIYSCVFTSGSWKRSDWTPVKKSKSDHVGGWVQQEDCIANEVPPQATPEELQNKRADETYSSMVYKEKVTGNVTVAATMSFTHKMAPLIVLAPELAEDSKGRKEYAEHFEIVIFNEGVNVWHHFVKDGKPTYRKAAFANFPLEKDTKYTLEVKKTGKVLTVSVASHTFGYADDSLPDSCYIGITGCEGQNRFYDFTMRR
ncbi:MAG: hypothetical protein NTX50_26765 [Candidatus Sumerlaeota bacterium]|nr:hypothetical protein [Candidatus Sumerlaeota bacterium]